VWKLLYIFMLGYEVDFGHMEALSLISCDKYAEKQVCTTVLLPLGTPSRRFARSLEGARPARPSCQHNSGSGTRSPRCRSRRVRGAVRGGAGSS
jgi:hypothetical protein